MLPGYVPRENSQFQDQAEAVVNHIDHVCQLAGNAHRAAIGSDLDCGFGKEHSPSDIESLADLRKIANLLRHVGYAEPDVEGVMHANWTRFFRKPGARRTVSLEKIPASQMFPRFISPIR